MLTGERYRVREKELPSGTVIFEVYGYDPDGKRVRQRFKTRLEAMGRKQVLDANVSRIVGSSTPKATRLTDHELHVCERLVRDIGIDALEDAVEHYHRTYQNPSEQVTISDAVDMFGEDEEIEHLMASKQVYEVCRIGGNFAQQYPTLHLHEVTPAHIAEFTKGDADKTRASKKSKLGSLFNWALDESHRFIDRHPTTGASERKVKKAREDDVSTLSIEAVKALLEQASTLYDGSLIPYLALKLFAGIRSDEIGRLEWDDVNLDTGYIRMSAKKSKTGSARSIRIYDNLHQWIEPFHAKGDPIIPTGFIHRWGIVRHKSGFKKPRDKVNKLKLPIWPRNVLRHTAVTYHLKVNGEMATVDWAGHDVKVMLKHYVGLATQEDAERYWSIVPR